MNQTLRTILKQIQAAKPDLDTYRPTEIGWYGSTVATANLVVPWLCETGKDICRFVEEVCNSSTELRSLWKILRNSHDLGKAGETIDRLLGRELLLVSEIAGDVMSRVLTDYVIGTFPANNLAANSKSDFPDLFIKSRDYSGLPIFTRPKKESGKDVEKEYGAAIKGGRPVRIADGIEVKTCGPTVNVDCHNNHMGLHLCLCQTGEPGKKHVTDLMIGFLRSQDYKERGRSTTATTVKYSFGPDKFVSLLSDTAVKK